MAGFRSPLFILGLSAPIVVGVPEARFPEESATGGILEQSETGGKIVGIVSTGGKQV